MIAAGDIVKRPDMAFVKVPYDSVLTGKSPRHWKVYLFRTRRPLPKQEEMPLDQIEQSLKWIEGNGKYPLDHDEMFGEVCNCLRFLRDEIQKLKEDR